MNLLYLADFKYGGIASFNYHLAECFRQCGHDVYILKIKRRAESRLRRKGLLTYQNITLDDLPRDEPAIITWAGPVELLKPIRDRVERLAVMVYDPNEVREGREDRLAELQRVGIPIISIREHTSRVLEEKYGLPNTFIPLPYIRRGYGIKRHEIYRAVTLCKIFPYKNIPMVLDAINLGADIRMFGELFRPMIMSLDDRFPDWRDSYGGEFDDAVLVASNARYVIDLTVFPYDGGGAQYTFLEAWDAGAQLIVNRKWLVTDELKPFTIPVENAQELAEVVKGDYTHEPYDFARHEPESVVPKYLEVLR